MKPHVRILGIDDSPFQFKDERTPIVGALLRIPNYLEAVMITEIDVDGLNATEKILEMINHSRYRENISLILIDGAALGGFNVVDIDQLHEGLKIPVATVSRKRPNKAKIEGALKKKFKDWEKRLEVISRRDVEEVSTKHNPLHIQKVGMDFETLRMYIHKSILRGALPEPIRVAHLIASALKKGESYGRA